MPQFFLKQSSRLSHRLRIRRRLAYHQVNVVRRHGETLKKYIHIYMYIYILKNILCNDSERSKKLIPLTDGTNARDAVHADSHGRRTSGVCSPAQIKKYPLQGVALEGNVRKAQTLFVILQNFCGGRDTVIKSFFFNSITF